MKRHSIRLRLTAWYGGSILLLLLVATVAARTLVRNSLEAEFARSQETAASLVRGFFRAEVLEYRHIEATLAHISGELAIPDREIDYVRPDGSDYAPPPSVRVMPTAPLPGPVRYVVRPLDPDLAPGWQLRVGSSAAPLVRQLRDVDRWALLAVPAAFLVALGAGWVLTGRTLRPVAAMADAADRISATAAGRIPLSSPDDELGRLGARFNALLDRLDQSLVHQRRFLADAAHELRTPIARARGASELALATPAVADDREALAHTQRELEQMSGLVDQLLELARADLGPGDVRLERGFLDDVAADVVRAFGPLARRQGVTLQLDAPTEVPARVEPESLRRMLGVFVDNAIRYSPQGGEVVVAARMTPTGPMVEVSDRGVGIPADERTRLFERFFRGSEARRLAPDGSGLGLPIAAAIAERHGAEIAVGEHPPRGTRVTVTFPVA